MMIKSCLRMLLAFFCLGAMSWAYAADKPDEPNRLFYQGNTLYQAGDYVNALLAYDTVLDRGLESGSLYYNIGNAFLKLNKYGHAILFYERARRMLPFDSDVRSNLEYARSLAGESALHETTDNVIVRLIKRPCKSFSLDALAILTLGIYLMTIFFIAIRIVNPVFAKKIRLISWLSFALCLYALTAFAVRYYSDAVQKNGIVLQKDAVCRYEPIEKSATYYRIREGSEVTILATRDDWRRIRRADGKIGWVTKTAVEPI